MSGIKIAVLIALAIGTMACLGTGPAIADEAVVLCKENEEACKKENHAGETFTATSEVKIDFGELGIVKCSSTMSRNEARQINTLSFTGCSEGCSVTASNLPYASQLIGPSAGNGKIHISSGGGGEPRFAFKCGGLECVYGLGIIESEFKGGKPASIVVNKSMTRKTESFFCSKTAKWEASYLFTAPTSAVYMANRRIEGPVFCKVNEEVCPQKSIVSSFEAELKPEATFKVTKLVGGAVNCSYSGFFASDNKPFEEGPWFQISNGISECTHSVYKECGAEQTEINSGKLFPFGGGDGEIAITSFFVEEEEFLSISCLSEGSPFTCVYTTEEFGLEFEGGEPATVQDLRSMVRTEGSKTFCPGSVVVQASYEVLEGLNPSLYLTKA